MLEFTFSFHYRMEEAYNPWNVTSLEAFHFYNCPECEDKYSTKEQFVCHAMMVHEKARDTLPGILQVQNNIVISNVQSVMEQEICDDVKSDLESSISIEKVEPMSDTETVENDENYDASNIANRSDDSETVENCHTSITEPVMIKISRKDKKIGDASDIELSTKTIDHDEEDLSDHPRAPGANSTFSEVSESDVDRTSNSSWSSYSGQNDNVRIEPTANEHSPSPELPQSLPNASNPISADFGAMVEKLSGIEEEKWSLQQKVEMLEISAAAMADDLVKKSNIIQFYCMEGKQDHVKKESVQSTTPAKDKIKNVKKVMDFLVHPDQLDAQYKEEVQRMQRMLEETLTKNMHLQKDLEHLSQEVVRLSKLVPTN